MKTLTYLAITALTYGAIKLGHAFYMIMVNYQSALNAIN